MSEKIYIKASVKESKYGLRLSGKSEEVIAQIKANTNEKGYFNWNINPRKEKGKYGETHSVTVDTWQPEEKKTGSDDPKDDLPF